MYVQQIKLCNTHVSAVSSMRMCNIFNCVTLTFLRCPVFEPSREKTNIVVSALSIDPDQSKHAAQAYPVRHFSPPVYFLFQELLLFTSIPLRWNVSAQISLCGLLIWVNTLRDGSYILLSRCDEV